MPYPCMSYVRKRGIQNKVFLAYSNASFFGIALCVVALLSIFTKEAFSQTKEIKKSSTENTQTEAPKAEIESDINNSESNRKQDAEMSYFFGNLPAPAQQDCQAFESISASQVSDIAHFFVITAASPCGFKSLAISKQGVVAAAKSDGSLQKAGKLAKPARVAAFHSGSGRLAVYDGQGLKIIENGVPDRSFVNLKARPYSLSFAPDGESLLIGAADSRLYRWRFIDYEKGRTNKERDLAFERYIGHASVISAVAFHPFGRVVFSGDWKGAFNVWLLYDADKFKGKYDQNDFFGRGFIQDTKRKKVPRTNQESVDHLVISQDGEFVFLGLKDGTIEAWQVRGMRRGGFFKAHKGLIYDLAVDHNGKTIVSIGRDGLAKKIAFTKEKTSNKITYSFKEQASIEHSWIRHVEQTGKGVFSGAGLQGKIRVLNF